MVRCSDILTPSRWWWHSSIRIFRFQKRMSLSSMCQYVLKTLLVILNMVTDAELYEIIDRHCNFQEITCNHHCFCWRHSNIWNLLERLGLSLVPVYAWMRYVEISLFADVSLKYGMCGEATVTKYGQVHYSPPLKTTNITNAKTKHKQTPSHAYLIG